MIAHSARDADFIGIGRLSSGPNDGGATFEITQILKGLRRKPYVGSAYFAHVQLPLIASDIVRADPPPELLLFLTENGMDLDRAPAYALTGAGLVIADADARKVVRDTLARTPQQPRLPFCVAMIVGYAGLLSADDNRALKAHIADAFADAGTGRCIVGRSSGLSHLSSPDWVGDKIRELFLGASRAVLVSIDNRGGATLSGIRIGSDNTKVIFAGESWPPSAPAQRDVAQRLMERLVTAE